MIEARNELMTATNLELPLMTDEAHQEVLEALREIEPPRESDRALAKYAVQRSLRLEFSAREHIECASPETEVRTWGKKVMQVYKRRYGDTDGFLVADLELEAILMDKDEEIYD